MQKTGVNVMSLIAIFYVLAYTIYISIKGVVQNVNEIKNIQLVAGVNFILAGCLFMFSGVLINLRIRKYFREFYNESSTLLWSATFFLSVPLVLRGSLDLMRIYDEDLEDLILKYGRFYNPIFWIITDLIPLYF